MLRACRLRLCANQSSIPASSSTTDLAPSVSTVKFLHPPVQLHLLRFRVRPSGSCASCPGIPSQKTSAALSNLTLDRNRVYQPCYATSPWIRSEDSQKAYNSGNHRTQRNRSESSVVYSPIQSSKMVLPTVNSGPPLLAVSPPADRAAMEGRPRVQPMTHVAAAVVSKGAALGLFCSVGGMGRQKRELNGSR